MGTDKTGINKADTKAMTDEVGANKIDIDGAGTSSNIFRLSFSTVSYIEGHLIRADDLGQNILFVPDTPNYPYVDLCYYDCRTKTLYPMQI